MTETQDWERLLETYKKQEIALAEKQQGLEDLSAKRGASLQKLWSLQKEQSKERTLINQNRKKLMGKLKLGREMQQQCNQTWDVVNGQQQNVSDIERAFNKEQEAKLAIPGNVLEDLRETSVKMQSCNLEKLIEEYQVKTALKKEALTLATEDWTRVSNKVSGKVVNEYDIFGWERLNKTSTTFEKNLGEIQAEIKKTLKNISNIEAKKKELQQLNSNTW